MRLGPAALATAAGLLLAGAAGAQTEGDIVGRGAWEYRQACAVCHGPDGRGESAMAGLLKVAPPDLTTLSERNGGAFPFERVLRIIDGRAEVEGHGGEDMPVWGRAFRADAPGYAGPFGADPEIVVAGRIYALAKYLRAIQGGATVAPVEPRRRLRSWPEDSPIWPK